MSPRETPQTSAAASARAGRRGAKQSTSEPAELRAVADYGEALLSAGSIYLSAWSAFAQASLGFVAATQDAGLKAAQAVADASLQSTRSLTEQWAEALQQTQIATAKLAAAQLWLIEASIPSLPR